MEEEGKTCPGNTSRCTGWWPGQSEAFLQRQGWMSGQTNFFKVNCWPSSENMKVESGKYPHQIQQATDMLAARGILDGEESQAPWSSSLPPHRRPHHHQVSRWDSPGFPAMSRCPWWTGTPGRSTSPSTAQGQPCFPGQGQQCWSEVPQQVCRQVPRRPNLGTSYSALWFNRGMGPKL